MQRLLTFASPSPPVLIAWVGGGAAPGKALSGACGEGEGAREPVVARRRARVVGVSVTG